jgi:hypothetical protein
MATRCEVCESLRPAGDRVPNRKLLSVPLGARDVVLCVAHASIAESSGVRTLEGLRELYGETLGRRSYVARRARSPVPSPNGDPRRTGRRASDVAG